MSQMEELIETLSDEDLYHRLKEFKPDLGPVVDSTRSLYKRLLLQALQGDPNAASILNSSKESVLSQEASPSGPVTRSKTSTVEDKDDDGGTTEEDDQETEEDEEAMDVADDDFEILDNRELEGEDQYFQRQDTATSGEASSFLIRSVVVGLIFAVLAIIAVAVWIPPSKKV